MRNKKNILIMKVGALGDVLRTTPILHEFKNDNVTWLTSTKAVPLLQRNQFINKILTIEYSRPSLYDSDSDYSIVLNMDEDARCCSESSLLMMLGNVGRNNFYGYFLKDGAIDYKGMDKTWFNMGLSSKFGKERANELKLHNARSYEDILFAVLGHKFNGEEYILNCKSEAEKNLVG